jgi:hypothetical protein
VKLKANGVAMSVAAVECPKHEKTCIMLAFAGDHAKGRFELTAEQATDLATGLLVAASDVAGDAPF